MSNSEHPDSITRAELEEILRQYQRPLINIPPIRINWGAVIGGAVSVFVAVWTAGAILGVGEVRSSLYQLNQSIGELKGQIEQMEKRLEDKIDRNTELLEELRDQ